MRKNRILALALAIATALSITTPASAEWSSAERPTDINATETVVQFAGCSEWAYEEMVEAQRVQLFPFVFVGADLTKNITRAEFAAVAVQLYQYLSGKTAPLPDSHVFVDTESANVMRAYAVGIVTGVGNRRFDPNSSITREDAATMITRAYKAACWAGWTLEGDAEYTSRKLDYKDVSLYADDREIHDYAYAAVYYLTGKHVLGGVGNRRFAPQENCTREQAVAMSLRFAQKGR